MQRWMVLIGCATLLGGCDAISANASKSGQSGRFTVVQAGNRTVLLDTHEGRAWELLLDPQGNARGWSPIQSLP
jgi:hypothetical protein